MSRVLLLSALATALLASPGAEAFVGNALFGMRLIQGPTHQQCGLSGAHSAPLAAAGGQQRAMIRGWSLPSRVRAAGGVRSAVASADVETAEVDLTTQSSKGPGPTAGAKTGEKKTKKDSTASASYKQRAGRRVVTPATALVRESYDKEKVRQAFDAFAFTLLRTKGRSRFATINNAFRREFSMFRDETVLSNQTVGRFVQVRRSVPRSRELNLCGEASFKPGALSSAKFDIFFSGQPFWQLENCRATRVWQSWC
jgi:hypothetical protein